MAMRGHASAWLVVLILMEVMSTSAQTPNPGNNGAIVPATPKKPDTVPPPLPPDVVAPDPPPPDDSQNGNPVARTLKRLAPNCINAIFHACWSSPPQKPRPT